MITALTNGWSTIGIEIGTFCYIVSLVILQPFVKLARSQTSIKSYRINFLLVTSCIKCPIITCDTINQH